ncbi:aryl-sulfate sulfotransferase [Phenylobacterium sp. 20VBR1]|uniref:Aryl-sulfate sulfotransferase n=1 Tax=Phenylobacterium glaciei TaxID=2803784 RepID=A0A941D0D6_9CAUL|nr:arylsulfotransferase family protein [Phenylobacterium glaciei]MBR7619192.1 aryl-sulfate sulfotransferase [Phenylobacterium glaciei]
MLAWRETVFLLRGVKRRAGEVTESVVALHPVSGRRALRHNWLPLLSMFWGVALFSYLYGVGSQEYDLFPADLVHAAVVPAKKAVATVIGHVSVPYAKTTAKQTITVLKPEAMQPGLTMLSGVGDRGALFVKLVDAQGRAHHTWDLDFFSHWPNPVHVPADERPKQRPGTHIHGMSLSPNGDLTFNYEYLGTMQVDICGRTKWRLPRQTHHSLFRDEDGYFWTSEAKIAHQPRPDLPGYKPPFFDYKILKVSPQGKVVEELDMFNVIQRSGYTGLLYQMSQDNDRPQVTGDTLHVNRVEVFPASMTPGIFKPGDIMVSMRNINTVIVIDQRTHLIKTVIAGRFVRQHDTRFVDGSTISVFDNNNIGAPDEQASSRILLYSVAHNSEKVLFEGNAEHPFFTYIMGKQHQLENGGLLVTEAVKGRAIEVDREGHVVWTYNNIIKDGLAGLLEDAQRIPPGVLSEARLAELSAACPKADKP